MFSACKDRDWSMNLRSDFFFFRFQATKGLRCMWISYFCKHMLETTKKTQRKNKTEHKKILLIFHLTDEGFTQNVV